MIAMHQAERQWTGLLWDLDIELDTGIEDEERAWQSECRKDCVLLIEVSDRRGYGIATKGFHIAENVSCNC